MEETLSIIKPDAMERNLEDEIIKVNMVQRMTDSGRRVRFNVMACVGNKDGYVGLGMAKAKEVSQAIRKAMGSGPDGGICRHD